ncbi:unnamed protein product [Rhizophagus irregularis]|nr:unnamed protein product [Rhizophagus irregularis]
MEGDSSRRSFGPKISGRKTKAEESKSAPKIPILSILTLPTVYSFLNEHFGTSFRGSLVESFKIFSTKKVFSCCQFSVSNLKCQGGQVLLQNKILSVGDNRGSEKFTKN